MYVFIYIYICIYIYIYVYIYISIAHGYHGIRHGLYRYAVRTGNGPADLATGPRRRTQP